MILFDPYKKNWEHFSKCLLLLETQYLGTMGTHNLDGSQSFILMSEKEEISKDHMPYYLFS
jgi:hypothetical protein